MKLKFMEYSRRQASPNPSPSGEGGSPRSGETGGEPWTKRQALGEPAAPHPSPLRGDILPKRGGIGRLPCGSLLVGLNATPAALRCSGGLWLPDQRTLVVADLHLEKGSSFARRGVMLPPFDTRATLARLEAEVAELSPERVVLLGDTFHDRQAHGRLAFDDRLRVEALARGRRLVWIVGNHDADGPGDLPGEVADELAVGTLILRHEPEPGRQPGEVSGHLHPCARVAGKARSVRRRCFLTDGERLILPAFGAYAGGLNVLDRAYRGLFGEGVFAACLGDDKVRAIRPTSLLPD